MEHRAVAGEFTVKGTRLVGAGEREAKIIVIDLFVGDRQSPKGVAPALVCLMENELELQDFDIQEVLSPLNE